MFNVLIADDNQIEREYLRFLLEEIRDVRVVGEAADGLQALELAGAIDPDIVFLDINMPKVDGIGVARQMAATGLKTSVVFVTVESKYAVEAFELNTVDYLLKPFDRVRLRTTLLRVQERTIAKVRTRDKEKKGPLLPKTTKLFVRVEESIQGINIPEIVFVEKDGKNTLIHTSTGMHKSKRSISEIQQKLAGYPNFARVHRAFLINFNKIAKVTPLGSGAFKASFDNYPNDALISRKNAQLMNDLFA